MRLFPRRTVFREESQVGFLMLQWLGVLVPGAFRKEVATWGGRRPGKSADIWGAIDLAAAQPTPVRSIREKLGPAPTVTSRARRLVEKMNEHRKPPPPESVFMPCPMCGEPTSLAQLSDPHGCCEDCYWKLPDGSVGDRQDRPEVYAALERETTESVTFRAGETLTWPNAEAMLRGDPPTPTVEFERALLRSAAETGSAIIDVDPASGTVTVGRTMAPEDVVTPEMLAREGADQALAERAWGSMTDAEREKCLDMLKRFGA